MSSDNRIDKINYDTGASQFIFNINTTDMKNMDDSRRHNIE